MSEHAEFWDFVRDPFWGEIEAIEEIQHGCCEYTSDGDCVGDQGIECDRHGRGALVDMRSIFAPMIAWLHICNLTSFKTDPRAAKLNRHCMRKRFGQLPRVSGEFIQLTGQNPR